jgi:hypothetical protein
MLFKSILNQKTAEIQPEFDKFFNDVVNNQTHLGDFLLIYLNGFYNSEVFEWTNVEKPSPYAIGPNKEGHSENIHHEFLGDYLQKSLSDQKYQDYLEFHKFSPERAYEIEKLAEKEANSIQYEMLIYLKIWEMDSFIKKYYQLTRLISGQEYDWYFSIAESNRDKKATGTRETIIRKLIRDKLIDSYPKIYAAIKNAYKTQLRNSIAHSKYSLHGRYIHLNNYVKEDPASQTEVISFDEWIDIIHDTIIMYTQLTRLFVMADALYNNIVTHTGKTTEIRITRNEMPPNTTFHILERVEGVFGWDWKRNDTK